MSPEGKEWDDEQYLEDLAKDPSQFLTGDDDADLVWDWFVLMGLVKDGVVRVDKIRPHRATYLRLMESEDLFVRSDAWVLELPVELGIVKNEEAKKLKSKFLELLDSEEQEIWSDSWLGVEFMLSSGIITRDDVKEHIGSFTSCVREMNRVGEFLLVDRDGVDLDLEYKIPELTLDLQKLGLIKANEIKGMFREDMNWQIPEELDPLL